MKRYKGLIIILVTFFLTYIFWYFEQSGNGGSSYRDFSQLIASLALVSLAWINYISTRHGLIDGIFNGLDKSYIHHKYLSILAVIFIWIHNFTLKMGGRSFGVGNGGGDFIPTGGFGENYKPGLSNFLFSGKQLGSLSMYIFTALVIFFIIAYKLEYQKWKLLHTLLLIPYVFGVIHYYLDTDYDVFSTSAYSIWMNVINVIGVVSALYSIFLYEMLAFKYRYKVSNIREVAKNTIEITGTTSSKEMNYKPGQFAFMKVLGRKKGFPSHPFTICQAHKAGEIQFSIKVLGDHTSKLIKNLTTGDTIALAGPNGKFNYRSGTKRQIWVAGGIGITPFRSFWQSEVPQDYSIDFFYAYNNEADAPYVDELKVIKPRSNLKIHLFDSSKTGFLNIKDFENYLNKDEQYDVFFCGPAPMRKKIIKDLKKGLFKIRKVHFEYFQFK